MSNQNVKFNLVKVVAIAAVILPTVLLQAQSSQAIPLDGILDAAGKSFLINLFGGAAAPKPAEQPATTETENTNPAAAGAENTDTAAVDANSSESEATTEN